ncbi:MAG: hypothetical protein HYU42_06850 [Candidatus Rokubacteria bacterium]|nr:hypothetical protein [Candidatus Rokubacteria bacterium]
MPGATTNAYQEWTSHDLVIAASRGDAPRGVVEAEMMRRLREAIDNGTNAIQIQTRAIEGQTASSDSLGRRIYWLNLLLLLFTVGIFALTVVLTWPELRRLWGF